MVAFKRFFNAEKGSPTPVSREQEIVVQTPPRHNLPSRGTLNSKTSQTLNGSEHFQKIERQFEVMHDQLRARPTSPHHIPLACASSRLTNKSSRHVDLLEAFFSSQRHHVHTSGDQASPGSPYNEDVAERNMAPFLQSRRARSPNMYSRLLSVLYQEDVADRNIAKSQRRSRSLSRSTTRSRTPATRYAQADSHINGDDVRGRPGSKTKGSRKLESTSRETIRSMPVSHPERLVPRSNDAPPPSRGTLRTHRSAPTILSEQGTAPSPDILSSGGHLGVPPAHKQGETWSHTPLPDSPTLPISIGYGKNGLDQNGRPRDPQSSSKTPSPRLPSNPRNQRPPLSPRTGSKKNVRDLSINVELASRGRPKKIAHRAIQPPTPNTFEMKQNPSIAEVMNSPLPAVTPTSLSPLPMSNQKVAEIMDMFRQAYSSTQAITPHPTFETLQDAIVREINSHEAFRNVPIPEAGPPFTPSPSQGSSDKSIVIPKSTGSASIKDGQFSKLIRKGSFKRSRRGSERKSISTSIPSSAFRQAPEPTGRRRHTDAPPPSPGFFEAMEPKKEEPVTYMDLLLRSEKPGEAKKSNPSTTRTFSMGTLPPGHRSATPSVLCMRAQTSTSSSDGRTSFSVEDSDEDILQLPSVSTIPQVQIQGVDENNVTYVAENTTPRNAYRLMNWPRKPGRGRSISLRGAFASSESNSSRDLRIAQQSVESY